MSVSVVNQDTLSSIGINSVRDLTNVTSGFQLGAGGSYPQPAIRGVTTINAGSYENNVAVFVDGLYQSTPQVLNMDLPNVRDIQILKGPQGTLYGRNATGGAILLNTIEPGDAWEGNGELTYGNYSDQRARAYVAGPLTDSIGLMLAVTSRETDGYFKRASRSVPGGTSGEFLGVEQQSFRSKLNFEISDDFRASVGYNYLVADDPRGVIFSPIENVSGNFTSPGNDTRATRLGVVSGDAFKIDFEQNEGFLKLEYDTGKGMIKSLTGWAESENVTDFDFYGTYQPDIASTNQVDDSTFQQSLDFSTELTEDLFLIVGGTYYDIETKTPYGTTLLGPALLGAPYPDPADEVVPLSDYLISNDTRYFRTKEAWALFVEATYKVTERLTISLGGRHSDESQDVSILKYGFGGKPGGTIVYDRSDTKRGSDYSKFTPSASISYAFSDNTNMYASYTMGFRGGEWNSRIPNDDPDLWTDVGQESIDAYELGVKTSGDSLRVDAAVFYYDYTDLQVSFTSQVNGVPVVILQSAPDAEIYGAEVNFDYSPLENLTIRGGATFLNAEYGDDFFFSGSGVNLGAPSNNSNNDPLKTFNNITVEQDLSGMQMSRAPDVTAFIGADYLIPVGDGGWRFAVNAKYTDDYVVTNPSVWGGWVTDPGSPLYDAALVGDNRQILAGSPYENRANSQRATQDSFVLFNASITWMSASNSYYVRAWGNNLGDEEYRTHYNPLSAGSYAPIGEPRTYGLTVGYNFGAR